MKHLLRSCIAILCFIEVNSRRQQINKIQNKKQTEKKSRKQTKANAPRNTLIRYQRVAELKVSVNCCVTT